MTNYKEMFISYLEEGKVPYSIDEENLYIDGNMINITEKRCKFFSIVTSFEKDKYIAMLETANKLNSEYSYAYFQIVSAKSECLCATYNFYLYGSEKEAADQILKTYYVFSKTLGNVIEELKGNSDIL